MNKQLVTLFILIVAVSVGVFFLNDPNRDGRQTQELMFPTLAGVAENIGRIEITNRDGQILVTTRDMTGWSSPLEGANHFFPVDQDALISLLDALSSAKILETKTAKPENFAALGLVDVSQSDSQASRILVTANGQDFDVIVGNSASSGLGSYIRFSGDNQTWLVNRTIPIPLDKFDWLQQPILSIETLDVDAVIRQDQSPWRIVKQGSDEQVNYVLDGLTDEQALKYDGVLDGFVETIVDLEFETIQQQLPSELLDVSPVTLEIALVDGEAITLSLYQSEAAQYVAFSGSQRSAHWQGLFFQISAFSAGQLNKQMSDFIEVPAPVVTNPSVPAIDEGESPSGGL